MFLYWVEKGGLVAHSNLDYHLGLTNAQTKQSANLVEKSSSTVVLVQTTTRVREGYRIYSVHVVCVNVANFCYNKDDELAEPSAAMTGYEVLCNLPESKVREKKWWFRWGWEVVEV